MNTEIPPRLTSALSRWGRACEVMPHNSGGANSRIFSLVDESGVRICAKLHHVGTDNLSPRYQREKRFYQVVQDAVGLLIPTALHWDDKACVGFFQFIDGTKVGGPCEDDVASAGEFVRALQEADSARLNPASEAALQPKDHAEIIEARLKKLMSLSDPDASPFVRDELSPAWSSIRVGIKLSPATPIVSPSDFGFHNIFRRPSGDLCFFDFEHAGMDDPAKLVCDLFVRPDAGVSPRWMEAFCASAGLGDDVLERAIGLMDLYRIKWACIALNDFTPEGSVRREFAAGDIGQQRAQRLAKARALVREVAKS